MSAPRRALKSIGLVLGPEALRSLTAVSRAEACAKAKVQSTDGG
jgi:hypothetical protein